MLLTYYDDHDDRYPHIAERDRWLFPDEIKLGHASPIKRVKPLAEVTLREAVQRGVLACMLANDVPFTKGCVRD